MFDVCLCLGCGDVGEEWFVALNRVWKDGVVLCLYEL